MNNLIGLAEIADTIDWWKVEGYCDLEVKKLSKEHILIRCEHLYEVLSNTHACNFAIKLLEVHKFILRGNLGVKDAVMDSVTFETSKTFKM